jgi:hypothetical protein
MKHPHSIALGLLVAVLGLATTACSPHSDAADATLQPAVPAAPAIAPTAERAVQRSQERWAKMTSGDVNGLIAAYDFNVPERKRDEPLANFLGRMQMHRYEDAKVDEVVALKDDVAYLRVSTLWTPVIERTKNLKLEPGQSLTERISMIETWRFVGGDWCYLRPENEKDFFSAHPDLLKKDDAGTSEPADARKPSADGGAKKPGAAQPSGGAAKSTAGDANQPH